MHKLCDIHTILVIFIVGKKWWNFFYIFVLRMLAKVKYFGDRRNLNMNVRNICSILIRWTMIRSQLKVFGLFPIYSFSFWWFRIVILVNTPILRAIIIFTIFLPIFFPKWRCICIAANYSRFLGNISCMINLSFPCTIIRLEYHTFIQLMTTPILVDPVIFRIFSIFWIKTTELLSNYLRFILCEGEIYGDFTKNCEEQTYWFWWDSVGWGAKWFLKRIVGE